jgi:hypothetical protein
MIFLVTLKRGATLLVFRFKRSEFGGGGAMFSGLFSRTMLRTIPVLMIALSGHAQAQAQNRPSVRLDATFAPQAGTVAVSTEVRPGPVVGNENVVLILANSLVFQHASAGRGATVTISPTNNPFPGLQQVVVHFPRPVAEPVIRLRYAGRPLSGGSPPINMITPELVELSLDSMWLPIKPDLSMRFTVDARLSGLSRNTVVAAQGVVSRTENGFRVRRSVPEVDFAFVASPRLQRLSVAEFELFTRDPQSDIARIYRDHGPRALSFLENWFGRMPGSPARIAVVQRERDSGYARTGFIVLTEGAEANPIGRAKFVAHEFAHSWFRNASSVGEHRWLDESFAEYVSLRYVEHALGSAARETLLAPKRAAAETARPVFGSDRSDRELYSKGPLLLIALEERIGRQRMDRLVALVAERHIGMTGDFLAALAVVADPSTVSWFDRQLKS